MLTRRQVLLSGTAAIASFAAVRRSEAAVSPDYVIDIANPVNGLHPLATRLGAWWLVLPQLAGGQAPWIDFIRHRRGAPTAMAVTPSLTSGWGKWTTRPGGFGEMRFDGTDDLIAVTPIVGPPLVATGSITLCAWSRLAATPPPADDVILGAFDNGLTQYTLTLVAGSIDNAVTQPYIFIRGATTGQRYGATTLSNNTWYHIAGVYNTVGPTLDIYLNGILNNGTLTGTIPATRNATITNITIGARAPGDGFMNGMLDDIRIYSGALSSAMILQLYLNSRTGCIDLLQRHLLRRSARNTGTAATGTRHKARVF